MLPLRRRTAVFWSRRALVAQGGLEHHPHATVDSSSQIRSETGERWHVVDSSQSFSTKPGWRLASKLELNGRPRGHTRRHGAEPSNYERPTRGLQSSSLVRLKQNTSAWLGSPARLMSPPWKPR